MKAKTTGVKMKQNNSVLLVLVFSLFLLWSRWTSHEANLSPVLALFLMSGWVGQGRWYAFFLPLSAFFISDIHLGFYPGWAFNYISLALVILFGLSMKKSLVSFVIRGCGVAVLFFLVSNLGVWMTSGLYSLDGQGLFLCYEMGLPFFKTSLVSTNLFLAGFYFSGILYERAFKRDLVFH